MIKQIFIITFLFAITLSSLSDTEISNWDNISNKGLEILQDLTKGKDGDTTLIEGKYQLDNVVNYVGIFNSPNMDKCLFTFTFMSWNKDEPIVSLDLDSEITDQMLATDAELKLCSESDIKEILSGIAPKSEEDAPLEKSVDTNLVTQNPWMDMTQDELIQLSNDMLVSEIEVQFLKGKKQNGKGFNYALKIKHSQFNCVLLTNYQKLRNLAFYVPLRPEILSTSNLSEEFDNLEVCNSDIQAYVLENFNKKNRIESKSSRSADWKKYSDKESDLIIKALPFQKLQVSITGNAIYSTKIVTRIGFLVDDGHGGKCVLFFKNDPKTKTLKVESEKENTNLGLAAFYFTKTSFACGDEMNNNFKNEMDEKLSYLAVLRTNFQEVDDELNKLHTNKNFKDWVLMNNQILSDAVKFLKLDTTTFEPISGIINTGDEEIKYVMVLTDKDLIPCTVYVKIEVSNNFKTTFSPLTKDNLFKDLLKDIDACEDEDLNEMFPKEQINMLI